MSLKYVALTSITFAVGCGGSSSANLFLMDAPPAGVTAVNVYVASMDVHVDDKDKSESHKADDGSIDNDDKWQTQSVGRAIDLVQHQGESAADVLGQLDLPEGKITQIRLVIDTTQPNTATLAGGSTCDLDTSRVEKKGIKINHVFKAFASKDKDKFDIYVDFDLQASMTAQGSCYRLEPKISLVKVKKNGADEAI